MRLKLVNEPIGALLPQALEAWKDALGGAAVITCGRELSAAETATFATNSKVRTIPRPASRDQMQEVVRIAGCHRQPKYPVSTGKNWGCGSRVPVRDGCTLVELSRMNRITDFDKALGYVTVQPGVTQVDLWNFLKDRNVCGFEVVLPNGEVMKKPWLATMN
jgi:4-cresol dehydrogenase (hydroxylating) flavoprotein subunit